MPYGCFCFRNGFLRICLVAEDTKVRNPQLKLYKPLEKCFIPCLVFFCDINFGIEIIILNVIRGACGSF